MHGGCIKICSVIVVSSSVHRPDQGSKNIITYTRTCFTFCANAEKTNSQILKLGFNPISEMMKRGLKPVFINHEMGSETNFRNSEMGFESPFHKIRKGV